MLVSVVIPTYNRAGLVERAIHSVLAQSYRDLEIIVVDDASTDGTQDRIKNLQQADHRIQYIRHEKNQGSQAARNTGIRKAAGEYIAFLDSDNEWLPEKLQKQMDLFSKAAGSPGAVYCGYHNISIDGSFLNEFMPQFRGPVYRQTLGEWLTDTSTLVVRKDILEKINGFDEHIRAYQEWDLCIRMARVCEFDFVPECLALYHFHTSPSISKDRLADANGYLNIVEKFHNEILNECGKKALSEHYFKIGRLFLFADRFVQARGYFWRSIRLNPLKIRAMLHFGASLLGRKMYGFLRSLRKGENYLPNLANSTGE